MKSFQEAKIQIVLALAGEHSWASYWLSIMKLKPPGRIGFNAGFGNYGHSLSGLLSAYKNWDALFLTEWDHTYPSDILETLWNHDKPVVAAMYRSRQKKSRPYIIATDDGEHYNYIRDYPTDKLFEVDSVGVGAMLVRRDVFDNIDQPFIVNAENGVDVSLCRNIRKNGYRIWIDPQIKVGHLMYEYVY